MGPSHRYIDEEGYIGGFGAGQIKELLDFLAENPLGWSAQMAHAIIGNADRPELSEELANSFCRTDPEIAQHFARITDVLDFTRGQLGGGIALSRRPDQPLQPVLE